MGQGSGLGFLCFFFLRAARKAGFPEGVPARAHFRAAVGAPVIARAGNVNARLFIDMGRQELPHVAAADETVDFFLGFGKATGRHGSGNDGVMGRDPGRVPAGSAAFGIRGSEHGLHTREMTYGGQNIPGLAELLKGQIAAVSPRVGSEAGLVELLAAVEDGGGAHAVEGRGFLLDISEGIGERCGVCPALGFHSGHRAVSEGHGVAHGKGGLFVNEALFLIETFHVRLWVQKGDKGAGCRRERAGNFVERFRHEILDGLVAFDNEGQGRRLHASEGEHAGGTDAAAVDRHGPGQIHAGEPVEFGAGPGRVTHACEFPVRSHPPEFSGKACPVEGTGLQPQDLPFIADELENLVHEELPFAVKVGRVDGRGAFAEQIFYDSELFRDVTVPAHRVFEDFRHDGQRLPAPSFVGRVVGLGRSLFEKVAGEPGNGRAAAFDIAVPFDAAPGQDVRQGLGNAVLFSKEYSFEHFFNVSR